MKGEKALNDISINCLNYLLKVPNSICRRGYISCNPLA